MKQFINKIFIVVLFILSAHNIYAQHSQINQFYFETGISFQLGTHVNRIGLFSLVRFTYNRFQIVNKNTIFYYFTHLGAPGNTFEFQTTNGILAAYQKQDSISKNIKEFYDNYLVYKNSFSYFYTYYFDQIKTNQAVGTIIFQFNRFSIISDNDIFASPASDKFRTAAAKITYSTPKFKYAANVILWTGNPKHTTTIKNTDYPARFGYKNLSENLYGKYSNGILSLQITGKINEIYNFSPAIGIDSEKVRHAFQNRLIHDVSFVPQKIKIGGNPHYPMLDTEGNPYLFKQNQKIKPSKLYLQIFSNNSIFY